MKKFLSAVLTVLFTVAVSAAAALPTGKVNADKLNLRLGPGVVHPVVGSIPLDSEVTIIRVMNSWLEIKAPATLTAYVSEARINADGTLAGELNMRSKMDVKSPCLGTLPKGTKVERLEKRANGWVQIKIPESAGVKVYAAGFFVNYKSSDFDEKGNPVGCIVPEVEKKAAAEPETTAKNDAPAVKADKAPASEKKEPAAPAAEKDVTAETEKKSVEKIELQGFLVKWKYSETPETAYALLTGKDGFNQAFVTGDAGTLAGAENKQVKISGTAAGRFGNNGAIIIKADTIAAL